MSFTIGPLSSFAHRSSENGKKSLPDSANIVKKTLAVANQTLKENNTKWYTELPSAPNGKPPVITKLPPNMTNIISVTLETSQAKAKPIPLPRFPTTRVSPELKIGKQEKTLGPNLLSAVTNAKKALKTSEKKIAPKPLPRSNKTCLSQISIAVNAENASPPPPPQKNKPKLESASETAPTSSRRVSFQTGAVTKDPETPNTFPNKSILKKTPSLSNTVIESKKEVPKEELFDEWADVDRILSECRKYLEDRSSS